MAITNDDLERVRYQLELKINSVSVEHVHLVQAIGSYGERFTAVDARFDAVDTRLDAMSADIDRRFDAMSADIDRRFDAMTADIDRRFSDVRRDIERVDRRLDKLDSKMDNRFNVQTVLMTTLGVLVLFGEPIRQLLGF